MQESIPTGPLIIRVLISVLLHTVKTENGSVRIITNDRKA
jgi:hypothetical protein